MPGCVTSSVFPHTEPDEAARFMYLSSCADPWAQEEPEIIWPDSQDAPEAGKIQLVLRREMQMWYWTEEAFEEEDYGRYAVLIPKSD